MGREVTDDGIDNWIDLKGDHHSSFIIISAVVKEMGVNSLIKMIKFLQSD